VIARSLLLFMRKKDKWTGLTGFTRLKSKADFEIRFGSVFNPVNHVNSVNILSEILAMKIEDGRCGE
jgi:hypothetical protein